MRKRLEIVMGIMMLALIALVSLSYNTGIYYVEAAKQDKDKGSDGEEGENVSNGSSKSNSDKSAGKNEKRGDKNSKYTVVIDPGHGGFDPGKVGINKELEKDINLQISLKLEEQLKENNVNVVMTRSEDVSLDDDNGSKKMSDMKNRVKVINDANADVCVSIHQNSYSSKSVKGAQVFYYTQSEKGRELAAGIQTALKQELNDGNKRQEKANSDYYILLNSECTTVIVECGFLSNWEDSTNLKDDVYQGKVAKAVCSAVMEYLENQEE